MVAVVIAWMSARSVLSSLKQTLDNFTGQVLDRIGDALNTRT